FEGEEFPAGRCIPDFHGRVIARGQPRTIRAEYCAADPRAGMAFGGEEFPPGCHVPNLNRAGLVCHGDPGPVGTEGQTVPSSPSPPAPLKARSSWPVVVFQILAVPCRLVEPNRFPSGLKATLQTGAVCLWSLKAPDRLRRPSPYRPHARLSQAGFHRG